jgi:hypothetical protein
MLHCIQHKNKVIGLYSNYKKCNQMLDGLVANKFAKKTDLTIISYYENSITTGEYISDDEFIENFTSESTTESPNVSKKSEQKILLTDELDEKDKKNIKKTRDKQSKIDYNVNLLKQKKEKIEESKSIYKTDIELFNKFKKIKKETPTFIIPELFQSKFNLMIELEEQNKLTWENFHTFYKKTNIDTSYNKMFEKGEERKLLEISSDTE